MFRWLFLLALISFALDVQSFASEVPLIATGQTSCYDSYGVGIPCDGTRQDGDIRNGVLWDEPHFTDNDDGTITDNFTGLIWLKNGFCREVIAGISNYRHPAYQSPYGYIDWGNAITWAENLSDGNCGLMDGSAAGDWRLPSINEMLTLFNYENADNRIYLQSYGFYGLGTMSYWTSTSWQSTNAHVVYLDRNYYQPMNKTFLHGKRILPVRGSMKFDEWPAHSFIDNQDGTITDTLTGLMWLRASQCNDEAGGIDKSEGGLSWDEAIKWADNLENGKCGLNDGSKPGDWRLPNINELQGLYNIRVWFLPTWLRDRGFSYPYLGPYWSSTTWSSDHSIAYVIHGQGATPYGQGKLKTTPRVWPVRSELSPALKEIEDQSILENEFMSLLINVTNPDAFASLTYSATPIPDGAILDMESGEFTWKPSFDQSGNYTIMFCVNDDRTPARTDCKEMHISVGNVNRPPLINPIDQIEAKEYDLINFFVQASDPDADNIYISADSLPQGAFFDPDTGIFLWTPDYNQNGTHVIGFLAEDDGMPYPESSTAEAIITVNDMPPDELIIEMIGIIVDNPAIDDTAEHLYTVQLEIAIVNIGKGKATPARQHLENFVKFVSGDILNGLIDDSIGNKLIGMANNVIGAITM